MPKTARTLVRLEIGTVDEVNIPVVRVVVTVVAWSRRKAGRSKLEVPSHV